MKQLFDSASTKDNETISKDELRAFLRGLDEDFTDEIIGEMMTLVIKGRSCVIKFKDFLEAAKDGVRLKLDPKKTS